jgi:Cdc6-like AAA superfamily ATPase
MGDFYLSSKNSYSRLLDEFNKHGALIVAFDFDDTVYDFHKKGRLYTDVVTLLRDLKKIGCHLICWTGQEDEKFVKEYLVDNDIPFDTINEHISFKPATSRKIYANVYIDDRAGLKQVYNELSKLITTVNESN